MRMRMARGQSAQPRFPQLRMMSQNNNNINNNNNNNNKLRYTSQNKDDEQSSGGSRGGSQGAMEPPFQSRLCTDTVARLQLASSN